MQIDLNKALAKMHIASETNKGEIIPITHSAHRFVPCMLPTLFPTCFMNDDDDDGPHFFPDAGPTAIVTSHHAKGYSFAAECAAFVQVNFRDMTTFCTRKLHTSNFAWSFLGKENRSMAHFLALE